MMIEKFIILVSFAALGIQTLVMIETAPKQGKVPLHTRVFRFVAKSTIIVVTALSIFGIAVIWTNVMKSLLNM